MSDETSTESSSPGGIPVTWDEFLGRTFGSASIFGFNQSVGGSQFPFYNDITDFKPGLNIINEEKMGSAWIFDFCGAADMLVR